MKTMETGKIVRVFNNGYNVQVMCTDDRRLLSIYFENGRFRLFDKIIRTAGLKLNGLQINFDHDTVRVPSLSKRREYRFH